MNVASFARPTFSESYDVKAAIAAAPADAKVRGMFFEMLLDRAQRERGTRLGRDSYSAFVWYPMRDYMQLLVDSAKLFHPELPISEGLRRTGWTLYDEFESTMVGKAIFAVAGRRFDRLASLAHKAYEVSYDPCLLRAVPTGLHRVQVTMDPVWVFPDTYQVGAWEGACRFCRAEPEITMQRLGPGRVVFDIHYRPW